uniref:Alpha-(1,6)-fucosyltransferase n=1 Tax=Rhabditophanes sp. KR3021 TaxID=114890 RepID=A0AC35UFU2_9BILA
MARITRNWVVIWALVVGLIWICYIQFTNTGIFDLSSIEPSSKSKLILDFEKTIKLSETLLNENKKLRTLLETKISNLDKDPASWNKELIDNGKYSSDHDMLLKKILQSTKEMTYYVKSELKKQNASEATMKDGLSRVISLEVDAQKLYEDGSPWRKQELKKMTQFIQSKIYHLQNPEDCSKAKFAECDLNKGCGFGCQIHHVAYCFYMAFGMGRTLVLAKDGKTWRYSPKGWDSTFLPISKCDYDTHLSKKKTITWSGGRWTRESDAIVLIPIVDYVSPRPDFLPLALPKQIAGKLIELHSFPTAYFTGNIIQYAMRPNKQFSDIFDNMLKGVPFGETPIVGIHVRRTDKIGTEANFHPAKEYMSEVEEWFTRQELLQGQVLPRKVFVATDDASVIAEIRSNYENYKVYGDESIASHAKVSSRYEEESLHGIIKDIRFLSKCNYIVGTFSSQVSRIAYELMQLENEDDGGRNARSIDDVYYFGGQQEHNLIAIQDEKSNEAGHITFKKGDLIGIAGNHWDGYSKGTLRTGSYQEGLFPSYKVEEKWKEIDMEMFN